jgi:hypothetical protein
MSMTMTNLDIVSIRSDVTLSKPPEQRGAILLFCPVHRTRQKLI